MPARFTSTRWTYTATATSSQGNFPASNLNVIGFHPLLYSWRSNNQTTQQDLICDLGVSRSVAAVAMLNLNVAHVELSYSTNGSTYASFLGDPGGGFNVARNPFGKYANRMVIQTVTARYIRLRIPSQLTTNGATSFEVGMIWIANLLYSFPRGPQVGLRQTPKRNYIRAGNGVADIGPWYSEEEWRMTMKKTETSLYASFALAGSETPQLIYKNAGNTAEVGIFRLRDAVTFERNGATVVANPVLEEMV